MPGTEEGNSGFSGKPASIICGAIRESGLVSQGDQGVVLVSGGADSVALLFGLVEILKPESLVALHVNYGLREEAAQDQGLVQETCESLGVELVVHRAGDPEGNVQSWARAIRLGAAERLRSDRAMDWIAIGHNRSDQAETFLYRLTSSPGVRSLLAMPPRSGNVIRPLLTLDRDLIRRTLGSVDYADDRSNLDVTFARNRIRHKVMPELEQINSGVQLNIVRTRAELDEDEQALSALAAEARPAPPWEPGMGLQREVLASRHPAVRRRILRQLAEEVLGRPVAVSREIEAEVGRLLEKPEGGAVELGGGDRFVIRRGRVEVDAGGGSGRQAPREPVGVSLQPGIAAFGDWAIESGITDEGGARAGFGDPWTAFLDRDDLWIWLETVSDPDDLLLTVRTWHAGDRIEPLGMSGSKKLQDVFTDALVPAPLRRTWPVLVIEDTVIWVPGLARSKHLLIGGPVKPVLRLHATPPFEPLNS